MKRIILLVVALLLTFSLAACFDNPIVEEFTREHCENNPDDELCQLDVVGDLTDAEVLHILQLVIDNYDNADVQQFCNDHISITATSLLEDCYSDPTILIPDTFTGIKENATVEKVLSAQGDSQYVITVQTTDDIYEITFTVQLVYENEVPYIAFWNYNVTDLTATNECPTGQVLKDGECVDDVLVCDNGYVLVGSECVLISSDVSLEQAKTAIQMFIDIYLDSSLDSTQVCLDYFNDSSPSCAADRQESITNGAQIVLDNVIVVDDTLDLFGAEMTFINMPSDAPNYNYQIFGISIGEDGEYDYVLVDHKLDMEKAKAIFEEMIADFINPNIAIELIEQKYFFHGAPDGFASDRQEFQQGQATITVLGIELSADHEYYILHVQMKSGDDIEDTKMEFMAYYASPSAYHFDFMDDNGDYHYVLEMEFLTMMFQTYLDNTIDHSSWCQTYFGDNMNQQSCISDREKDMIELQSIDVNYMNPGDFGLEVGFTITKLDSTSETMDVIAHFNYDENGNIIHAMFEDPIDPLYMDFIHNLIDNYNDSSIDHSTYCAMFFDGDDQAGCVQKRTESSANNEQLYLEYFHHEGNDFAMGLRFESDVETYIEDLRVIFFYNQNNELRVRFENRDHMYQFPYDIGDAFIKQLIIDFKDMNLSDADFCYKYFPYMDSTNCFLERHALSSFNFDVMINYIDLTNEGFKVGIGIDNYDLNEYIEYHIVILLHYDQNNEIMVDWYYYHDEHMIDFNKANQLLDDYFFMVQDSTVTLNDFTNMYCDFDTEQPCIEVFEYLRTQYTYTVDYFDLRGNQAFVGVKLVDMSGNENYVDLQIHFFEHPDGYAMRVYFGGQPEYFDSGEAIAHLTHILTIFNDTTYDHQYACSFLPNFFGDCAAYRQGLFDNSHTLELAALWRLHDSDFTIHLVEIGADTVISEWFFDVFFYHYDNDQIGFDWINNQVPFIYLDQVAALNAFTEFVNDYQNPNITIDELAAKYMRGHWDEDFKQGRENELALGVTYVIDTFTMNEEFGPFVYHFVLTKTINGQSNTVEDNVSFIEYADGTREIRFYHKDDYGPEIDYDTANMMIQNFSSDILNQRPINEMCMDYFAMMDIPHCEHLINNIFLQYPSHNLVNIHHIDYNFFGFDVEFLDSSGSVVHYENFQAFFYMNEQGWYLFMDQFHPHHQFEKEFQFMDELGYYLQDPVTNIDAICANYFGDTPDCSVMLGDQFQSISHVYLTDFYFRDDENIIQFYAEVFFEYQDGSWVHRIYEVYFNVNPDEPFYANMMQIGSRESVPADAVFLPITTAQTVLESFVAAYQDPAVTSTSLCDTFFNGVFMDVDCLEGRNEFLFDNGTASLDLLEVAYDEAGVEFYLAQFTLQYNGITSTEKVPLRVYQLSNALYYIEFLDDNSNDPHLPMNDVIDRFNQFVISYNDAQLSTEQLCLMYFEVSITTNNCAPSRVSLLNSGHQFVVLNYFDSGQMNGIPTFKVEVAEVDINGVIIWQETREYSAHYNSDHVLIFDFIPY